MHDKRPFVLALVGTMLVMLAATPALADDTYPNRPIRLIVPYPAGGSVDALARLLSPKLIQAFSRQIVIDNRGGAGGIIGTEVAAKAKPDGYTMLMVFDTHAVTPSIYPKLSYDIFRDLAPVSLMITSPMYLLVHHSVPANNVGEFIALAKAKPGKLNYASSGLGSSNHLAGELFKQAAGVDLTHVPYKGGGPALLALQSGEIEACFTSASAAVPLLSSGRVRALGITGIKRAAAAADVATFAKQGLPAFDMTAWIGLLARAGTPSAIVSRWNAEVGKALRSPEIQERLSAMGSTVVASDPPYFDKFLREQAARWGKFIKEKNITAQ